jgi:hypothetical protein
MRRLRRAAALCAAAVAVPASAHADPTWTPPAPLPTFGLGSEYRVGFDGHGTMTVAATDFTSVTPFGNRLRVFTRRAGAADQQELLLSDPGVARVSARVAVATNGSAVLAWEEEDPSGTGNITYKAAYRGPGGWGAPATLAVERGSDRDGDPIPVISGDGDAAVVIPTVGDPLPDTGLPGGQILLARHNAGGWGAAATISTGSSDEAAAAFDGGDDLMIVWRKEVTPGGPQGPSKHAIIARSLTDGVLNPPVTISETYATANAGRPALGVSPGGAAVVAYSFVLGNGPGPGEPEAVRFDDQTGQWSPPQSLSDGEDGIALGVAEDASERAYVLVALGDDRVVLVRSLANLPFASPVQISPAGMLNATGAVAIQKNVATAVWGAEDWASGNYSVGASSWKPGAAAPGDPKTLDPASADAKVVSGLIADGGGSLAATWTSVGTRTRIAGLDGGGPVASDVAIPATGTAGVPLTFNARFADMWTPPATEASWDFGDGSRAVTSQQTLHSYAAPGRYVVTARSVDVLGNIGVAFGVVTIGPAGAVATDGAASDASAPVAVPAPVKAAGNPAASDPPRVAIDVPACPPDGTAAVCRRWQHSVLAWRKLTGFVTGADRVTVRAVKGRKVITATARPAGSRWTARLRGLSSGRWTITAVAAGATARRTVTLR